MEAAILTILRLDDTSPAPRYARPRRASSKRRASKCGQARAATRRRSDFPLGRSRSHAEAGGPGSRHLEPPLSPPFLSRSPPPPEMAEPRSGSHTHTTLPPAASLRLWPASGAGGQEPRAQRSAQPRRRSDHNCGSRHLETVPLPRPALRRPETGSTRGRQKGAPSTRGTSSGSRERLGCGVRSYGFWVVELFPSVCLCRSGSRHLETSTSVPPILFLLGQFFHRRPKARQRPSVTFLLITRSHRSRPQVPELGLEVATVRQEER